MRALYFDGTRLACIERDEPPLAADEARVRVRLAGICNTDLEIARGYMGFRGVLGHEFVGSVVEGPEAWRGRRVVARINFACRRPECAACRAGLGRHCPARRVMGIDGADGAFAETVDVPVANLHAVPDGLEDEAAVFCEPLAAAFEILEQLPGLRGLRTAVIGDGKLGLLVAQVLHEAGARVVAVGRHAHKLAVLEARGIGTRQHGRFDPAREPRFDVVVEASGRAEGLALALAATRPRGTLVLKSTLAEPPAVDLARIVIDEITLVGSRCGPFEPALAALADARVAVAPLVEARLPLERGVRAFEQAARRGAGKILLECA